MRSSDTEAATRQAVDKPSLAPRLAPANVSALLPSASGVASPRIVDGMLVILLVALVSTFLKLFWPNSINYDEALYLYAAKRTLSGEVMYRDYFEFWGPVANYALALMYGLFGVSMDTARGSMAVLHGIIVGLEYLVARRLGVRPILAAAVSLTHLAVFYPALPFSSPHWVATALTMLAFLYVVRAPVTRSIDAVGLGALTALIALTQQPKGAATAAAIGPVLIRDAWVAQRTKRVALVRTLAAYSLGILGVAAPILTGFVAAAGVQVVYDAVIAFPLGPYREFPFHAQGRWLALNMDLDLWRRLLTNLPPLLVIRMMLTEYVMLLVTLIGAARLLWQVWRQVDADEWRPLFVAVVFSILAITSVAYHPNYYHFAVVGVIWLSLLAESLEQIVRRCERRWRTTLVAPLTALAVLAFLIVEIQEVVARYRSDGVTQNTAFGRIHFTTKLAEQAQMVRTVLETEGTQEMFVYPKGAHWYLLTGALNPTRYQELIPGLHTPEQFADVQATLERKRVPFVLRTVWVWGPKGDTIEKRDPLAPYLFTHYQGVKLPYVGHAPTVRLYRRKPDGPNAP